MRLLIFLFVFSSSLTFAQVINANVYKALSDSSEAAILKQINTFENSDSSSQSNAYLGALYMKQANYLQSVSKKAKRFKEGRVLLEGEITAHPTNIEYHFLRLTIQENAPSILKYNKNIDDDLSLIYQNYSQLAQALKSVIINYSKKSNYLDPLLLKD